MGDTITASVQGSSSSTGAMVERLIRLSHVLDSRMADASKHGGGPVPRHMAHPESTVMHHFLGADDEACA